MAEKPKQNSRQKFKSQRLPCTITNIMPSGRLYVYIQGTVPVFNFKLKQAFAQDTNPCQTGKHSQRQCLIQKPSRSSDNRIMLLCNKYSRDETRENQECQHYETIYLFASEEEQPVLFRKNGIRTLAAIANDIFI